MNKDEKIRDIIENFMPDHFGPSQLALIKSCLSIAYDQGYIEGIDYGINQINGDHNA